MENPIGFLKINSTQNQLPIRFGTALVCNKILKFPPYTQDFNILLEKVHFVIRLRYICCFIKFNKKKLYYYFAY